MKVAFRLLLSQHRRFLTINKYNIRQMADTSCDVLIIGGGPAGIAAARSVLQEGKTAIVLEARSRVGGRAFTSDSLNVNFPLDHGAKWIHGGCSKNRLLQLWRDLETKACEAEYPFARGKTSDSEKANGDNTPPPFDIPDSTTRYEINKNVPTANMTRVIIKAPDGSISTREPSVQARKVAKQAFKDIIIAPLDNQPKFLNSLGCDSGEIIEKASLLEMLLVCHGQDIPDDEVQKIEVFTSICRNKLLPEHQYMKTALKSIESKEEQQAFQEEVMALFNIEIYTFFESWEGAPLHQISAKYGLETTCLPGGNVVVPDGYGELVRRLAQPLLESRHIRLGHKVVSVNSTPIETVAEKPAFSVRCMVTVNEKLKEFRAHACIIALPLGVLRASIDEGGDNHPKFNPALPSPLCQAIRHLGVTARNKIEMLFPFRWWPKTIGTITVACTHKHQSPAYHPYTTFIVESAASSASGGDAPNILVCYVAGDFAREIEKKTDAQIQDEVMKVLREANFDDKHGADIPDPIAFNVTRWVKDQFSRGSWSFIGKGSNPDDIRSIRGDSECYERGLFFAGEFTCAGSVPGDDMGCVHGAWVSGELAASAALKRIS